MFAAGALWTYVTPPLLLRDASSVRLRRSSRGGDELAVRLDERIAGHAPQQVLHVDLAGHIVRHDYTASAFGRWAYAAQEVGGYRLIDGVALDTADLPS